MFVFPTFGKRMPAVVSEDLATERSLFAPLDKNGSSGYNYLSIRRNRYWKQTMAAWSSIDAFCGSIYGRKNPGVVEEFRSSPKDACDFHEMQSPISSSVYGDQIADIDSIFVDESQNRVSDSDQRADDSDGSVSDRNFDSRSSRVLRSSSASSLARDVALHRSTSTEDATPPSYKTRDESASEVDSRRDIPQIKAKGYNKSGGRHLCESSSATLNSNCQRMAVESGSSSSGSCQDSSQATSQDHSIGTPQRKKVVSADSARKQSIQKVSYLSCNHSRDSQNPVVRHINDVGRSQNKLCGVCQQPYISHKELVLLSPGLFRQTTRCRRIGPRKAKNPTNRRWLYQRRNDAHKPRLRYSSLLSSNFLLVEALQTWLGRSFQRAKSVKNADKSMKDADESVKDADNIVAADDSSIETESFSESVKSKLYELIMQIKSRMDPDSSVSFFAKKVIASVTDDIGERSTIPKDNLEDTQKVGHPDGRCIHTTRRHENDADLQAAGGRNAMHKYATSKGRLESAADLSQTQLEDNLSNAGSIADRLDMSNTRQNPQSADSTENDFFQGICQQPRKSYIDNRRSRRKGYHGSSKLKRSANSQRSQENPDRKIAKKGGDRQYAKSRRASNRKLQWNEDAACEIVEDGRHLFGDKEINYLQHKNYTDGPSIYKNKKVDKKNMAVVDEEDTGQGITDDYDRGSVKQYIAYDTIYPPSKKYHYKCVTIEGRETVLKLEHDPHKICCLGYTSKTDQPKKNEKAVVEEYAGVSADQNDSLGLQSPDCKVENAKASEEPTGSVKFKPENEQSQGRTPCREPKLEEAPVEAPVEVGDGDDKVDEELKQSTVFHKKCSEREAEKERRILRRFAREPTDDVKIEPENERISYSAPCREPKTTEAQVEVGEGKDKVGAEVKYSTVFHKKYSRYEAEKERRRMRRFAREQMRAYLEKSKLEGETAPLRRIPSWSETYVKMMRRRHKHSNKQCIIGKQVMSTDNVEENQQKTAEEQAENAEESEKKLVGAPTENNPEKVEASMVDKTQPSKPPKLARQLPGLGLFDWFFRVPVATQMTSASKLEVMEPPSLTHTQATGRAAYLSTESQDVSELSTGPDMRGGIKSAQYADNICGAGIKSSQYTDNTRGVATDNEETIQEVESEIFQVPLAIQLTPTKKFELDNPSNSSKFQATRSANLKGSLDIQKRYEKIGSGEEIKSPYFKENLRVEETNANTTGVKARSEIGPTHLTPTRTFKIDNSSSRKTINSPKASQDIVEVSKRSVKGTEIKSPGFKNNTLVEQSDKKTTKQAIDSEITEIQKSTQLTSARKFKLDNPLNTKKPPTTSATNLKSSNDVRKKSKKNNRDEGEKSSQFKDNMSGKQANSTTVVDFPGHKASQYPAATKLTPERKFKIDSLSTDFKAAKMSQEMFDSTNKSVKGKDITFHDFKVRTLVEQTEKEIMNRMMEYEASQAQVPTILSPKEKLKMYSKSYNTKLKASGAAFFSKTVSDDYSKSPKKTSLGEKDTKPHHFKDPISVQKATKKIPGSETPEVLMPTQFTPKRQFKKGLTDRTKKLKASNEADVSKASTETMGDPKKADIGDEMEYWQSKDVFDEITQDHITKQAAESGEAANPDSPESVDVAAKEGDLLDIAIQKFEAGNSVGEGISVSEENRIQQIYRKVLQRVGIVSSSVEV